MNTFTLTLKCLLQLSLIGLDLLVVEREMNDKNKTTNKTIAIVKVKHFKGFDSGTFGYHLSTKNFTFVQYHANN